MSLSKRLIMAAGLLALGTSTVWADCSRRSASTVKFDMTLGRVVVSPDLPVGAVIVKQDWTMPGGNGVSYYCTNNNTFRADIVAAGVHDLGNKVYSTNVPGIGMRFSRGGSTVNIIYPGSYTSNGGGGRTIRWKARVSPSNLSRPPPSPAAEPWPRGNTPRMTGKEATIRSWKPT